MFCLSRQWVSHFHFVVAVGFQRFLFVLAKCIYGLFFSAGCPKGEALFQDVLNKPAQDDHSDTVLPR